MKNKKKERGKKRKAREGQDVTIIQAFGKQKNQGTFLSSLKDIKERDHEKQCVCDFLHLPVLYV